MRRFGVAMCSLLFVFCAFGFAACGPDTTPEKKVTEVTLQGVEPFYHVTETIDFSAMSLLLKYDDNTTKTLTKSEIDVQKPVKEDTQFILYTDGLSAETAGELTKKEYQFSCLIVGEQEKRTLNKVSVSDNMNLIYDVLSYTEPSFVSDYKIHSKVKENDESSFFKNDKTYVIGEDNAFKFKPILKLQNKTNPEDIITAENFNVNVTVEVKNGENDYQEADKNLYTYENFAIQFKDGTTGTYRISMMPVDFTKDFVGNDLQKVEFEFTVQDGYNAYTALDLGMINFVKDPTDIKENFERPTSPSIFYNESTNERESRAYYDIWKKFYAEKQLEPQHINGMFIHNNIKITPEDLPSEYFISAIEAENKAKNNNEIVGTLRDHVYFYTHYLEDNFTFNGNCFKLDFDAIPWQQTSTNKTGYYYENENVTPLAGHSTVFSILNKLDESGTTKAEFKNMDALGNTKNITSAGSEKDKNLFAYGGLILMKSMLATTVVENCIAKSWMIGWFQESNQKTNAFEMNYIKTYDCFNSGLYSWRGGKSTLSNSEFKRFGGPVMLLTCDVKDAEGKVSYETGWTVDDKTVMESFVTGQEAWFILNGAPEIVTGLKNLNECVENVGSSFLDKQERMNLKVLVMEDDFLLSDKKILDLNYQKVGSKAPFVLGNLGNGLSPIDTVLKATGYLPPVLMSNAGQYGCIVPNDVNPSLSGVFAPDSLQPIPNPEDPEGEKIVVPRPVEFEGNEFYLAMPLPGTSTIAGVVLDRYDYTPPAPQPTEK